MASAVLADTDVLIDAARGIAETTAALEAAEEFGPLRISIVTEMELIVGCRDGRELRRLDQFLLRFVVVRLDAQIAELAARLLRSYRLSHGLLIADALIAATALHGELGLLTNNRRDFRFIEGLELMP
jgi:predicted nucleic acid-binding protein